MRMLVCRSDTDFAMRERIQAVVRIIDLQIDHIIDKHFDVCAIDGNFHMIPGIGGIGF
ncbi:hypothetical protein SAMN05518856_1125 [Paenibacillus sp. OK003]|nr:hypothetical protein SAMN05518856_1125 [Paenibacillus sp. OK003]